MQHYNMSGYIIMLHTFRHLTPAKKVCSPILESLHYYNATLYCECRNPNMTFFVRCILKRTLEL